MKNITDRNLKVSNNGSLFRRKKNRRQ